MTDETWIDWLQINNYRHFISSKYRNNIVKKQFLELLLLPTNNSCQTIPLPSSTQPKKKQPQSIKYKLH